MEQIVLALALVVLATLVGLRLQFIKFEEGAHNLVGAFLTYGIAFLVFLLYLSIRAPWLLDEERQDEIDAMKQSLGEAQGTVSALQSRLAPKLGIAHEVFKVLTPSFIEYQAAGSTYRMPHGGSLWIQLLPQCLTDAPVEECRGSLLRVRRWNGPLERWVDTSIDEEMSLGWSMEATELAMTIHPGGNKRLNGLNIYEANQGFGLCAVPAPVREELVFNQQDIYRLDVIVTGRNCPPVQSCIEAAWGPSWDKPLLAWVDEPTTPPIVFA